MLLMKSSKNNFIFLPAFYLIMCLMKAPKNFGFLLRCQKSETFLFLWSPKVLKRKTFFFSSLRGTVEELFAYIFEIYMKFGYKNPSFLSLSDSVDVAT